MKYEKILCVLVLLAAVVSGESLDPTVATECRIRGGLPNVFEKLRKGKRVNIAYLGGSITAARNGWRSRTLEWFRTQYPQAKIQEINAAISGTGSDYGACRLVSDVLEHSPDLLFVEFRVNGASGFDRESVEGIFRQTWKRSPQTDICLVYTVSKSMLRTLQAGLQTSFGQTMESLANVYGIPSIDLGVDVACREKAGTLVFQGNTPLPGKPVFTKDGVHPGAAGHALYRDIIVRSLLKMFDKSGPGHPHILPPAVSETPWETTMLLPASQVLRSPEWLPVNRETDCVYTNSKGRTEAMLRGGWRTTKTGASFTIRWNGTTIGLSDIPQTEAMKIKAVIDGGEPIVRKRIRTSEPFLYSRFWYLPAQKPGPHTAVFTVMSIPEGQAFYEGQFLIIGTLETK